jgi:hypothetical protein
MLYIQVQYNSITALLDVLLNLAHDVKYINYQDVDF